MKRLIKLNLMNKIYNDKEFMTVATPILTHKEFLKTKSIVHHGNTRFNHSVRVAYFSYKLSKMVGGDKKTIIRAGTLHDFFLIRDDKNLVTETKMLIKHPTLAKENAINFFGINEKEQNIIESHMFPVSNIMPKSKEAWIVSLSDKLVAMSEGLVRARAQVSVWFVFLINFIK